MAERCLETAEKHWNDHETPWKDERQYKATLFYTY